LEKAVAKMEEDTAELELDDDDDTRSEVSFGADLLQGCIDEAIETVLSESASEYDGSAYEGSPGTSPSPPVGAASTRTLAGGVDLGAALDATDASMRKSNESWPLTPVDAPAEIGAFIKQPEAAAEGQPAPAPTTQTTNVTASKKKTCGALLGGLRSGALEKAVAKMEEDTA
jgi:hypothetical protein